MSPLNLDENQAQYQVRAFKPGTIQVNKRIFTTSIIITPSQLIENWAPTSADELSSQSLEIIKDLKPDVLLIGTGAEHVLLSPDIYGDLINQGIGVEVMSTIAACRTYNALSAEDRNVVAALIV